MEVMMEDLLSNQVSKLQKIWSPIGYRFGKKTPPPDATKHRRNLKIWMIHQGLAAIFWAKSTTPEFLSRFLGTNLHKNQQKRPLQLGLFAPMTSKNIISSRSFCMVQFPAWCKNYISGTWNLGGFRQPFFGHKDWGVHHSSEATHKKRMSRVPGIVFFVGALCKTAWFWGFFSPKKILELVF